jgi:hypothetical protein
LYIVLGTHLSFSQNYFQQEVKYTINVSLNDVRHELSAFETIVYINRSPGELKEIYMHLWPNAYKNNETALAEQFDRQGDRKMLDIPESDLGFIDSLNFTVDGESVPWKSDSLHIDICKLILNRPLKSGDSIFISTPFRVKLPSSSLSRLGHDGESYQISQWYPKPAVYDKNGWHPMPFLDQGEFFSEYGSFDVSITLPKNYVVGATGDLQTEEEKIFLEQKAEETKNISSYTKDMTTPESDAETKTIRFTQNNVHDFAWFADKRYHVLKGEVELPASNRTVNTWIMFTNYEADLWKDAMPYLVDATYYYSLWVGDYPFNNITAVSGSISAGGGMEYPNITVIGQSLNPRLLELTIAHEAGHNWFYGILGSNEREHPWMDEGINQSYELRYSETVTGRKNEAVIDLGALGKWLGIDVLTDKQYNELAYLISARSNTDQPLDLPSEKFSSFNYGTCVYYKTALSFYYLNAWMGDSLFDRCMKAYYEKWKFKHPSPSDVRIAFEETSGKNLSWFFDDLLKTTKKIDYKIVSCKELSCDDSFTGECREITLKNTGGVAGPVPVSTIKGRKIISTEWIEGFTGTKKLKVPVDIDMAVIDAHREIPEITRKNNDIRTSGMFKKWDKLHFRFLGSLEKRGLTQIFFLPVIGWNNYDKTMLGMALHNVYIPEKKFEYVLMPLYSTRTNSLVGGGNLSYNFYPGTKTGKEHWVRKMTLELGGQSYHFADFTNSTVDNKVSEEETFRFSKIVPGLTFYFNPAEKSSGIKSWLTLKVSQVNYETSVYQPCSNCASGDSSEFFYRIVREEKYFPEVLYSIEKRNAINPFSASLGARYAAKDDIVRIFGQGNYRFSYSGRNRGLDIRMFAGGVTNAGSTSSVDYRLRMSGYSGKHDYMFDHVFLGRTETDGILSQQFVVADGGFKTPTATGQSNSWLATINLKTSIPGRLPVRLFADIGWYDKKYAGPDQNMMYDYGVELTLIQDVFSIYVPIGFSDDIKDYYDANPDLYDDWYDRIRFELRFEKLNPIKLIRNIEL